MPICLVLIFPPIFAPLREIAKVVVVGVQYYLLALVQ